MKVSRIVGPVLLGACLYGAVTNSYPTDAEKDAVGDAAATNAVEQAAIAALLGLRTTLGLTDAEIIAAVRGVDAVRLEDAIAEHVVGSGAMGSCALPCGRPQWGIRGAWDDDFYFGFSDDWAFPHGSNHLAGVLVHSQGDLSASSYELPFVTFPFAASMVPGESSFATEFTPSNSYAFTWTQVCPGRLSEEKLDARIELFRNGNYAVSTNGCVAEQFVREPPFPHDGIGQDEDWVRANFTNANDILAVGYVNWVDSQVGVDLTNGLYKFTASFPDDPPESTELIVGDLSVCVTNAGEYVFVLEKGIEYSFGTEPYDAAVEYSMQDDVGLAAEIVYPAFSIFHSPFSILSSWWGDGNGVWTVDGDWQWISAPTLWGFGYCMWLPKFHGSPDVAHLGVNDFPMTFEAVLSDCCRTNGVTYRWSTSTEGVRILSPNSRVTQVEVDDLPSWDRFSLTVDAYLANETLTSSITTTYGTNATPQVSFTLSVPEVMFVNNDDDNDDGIADCRQVPLGDDDVVKASIKFHSDVATNATIRIERISGFDSGFYDDVGDFVFSDWYCTQPIREGAEFVLANETHLSVPLYVNPVAHSSGYEDVEVVASLTLDGGERREVTAKATVVYPVVEPICNETKSVVVGGESMEMTYNPCGVGIGERAYFKICVEPEDFPDSRIVWEAEGGLAFVGGNTGREVCVLGTVEGEATLRVRLREVDVGAPSFSAKVVPLTTVGIRAVIVSDGQNQALSESAVQTMVKTANGIYAQIGLSFVLESVAVTNLPYAFTINKTNVSECVWNHDQLTGLLPSDDGIECYFVKGIYDDDGSLDSIRGLTSPSGIVISACAVKNTLAHEIGHLCGARDVYISDPNGTFDMHDIQVSCTNVVDDWNGGCLGRGAPGARYYAYNLDMASVVGRMLMYGCSSEDDQRRDLPMGDVFGVWYTYDVQDRKAYERSFVPVGMARGDRFAIPRCW